MALQEEGEVATQGCRGLGGWVKVPWTLAVVMVLNLVDA